MTNANAWPFPREKRIEPDVQTELKDALQQLAKAGQRVRELEQENAELVKVAIDFKEAMAETNITPCECGEADCRTTRLRAALAKAGAA